MPLLQKKHEVYYNTKTKVYRTGATSTTYCQDYIFRDTSAEDLQKRHDEQLKQECREVQSSKRVEKVRQANLSMATVPPEKYRELVTMTGVQALEELKKEQNDPRIDNLKRAYDAVFDIVYQNEWDLFLTLTLRPDDSLDRTDPKEVMKPLRDWLANRVKRHGLRYILIPEEHKNGGIHAHMLCNGGL